MPPSIRFSSHIHSFIPCPGLILRLFVRSFSFQVATPVDWKHGQDVMILPTVKDEDAKVLFPKGWKTVKPYMRVTPQPNI